MCRARKLKIGGMCVRGHELTGDTIGWRPGKKEGEKYIECLICKRDGRARYEAKNTGRWNEPTRRAKESRARLEAAILADDHGDLDIVAKYKKYQDSKTAPHNALASKAPDEFLELNTELDKTRGLCFDDPDPWTEYDDPRWPLESTGYPTPTKDEANALCAGCPVLDSCRRWAEAEKPAWGIHAGVVWLDGEVRV